MQKLLTLLLISTCTLPQAFALCDNPQKGIEISRISFPGLVENSGIDFSNKHPGIFWSHNDAKHPTEIFAIGIDGKNYGKFEIKGATNVDWEDIAIAKCFHAEGKDCIYIGDIGDNERVREDFKVYVVEESQDYKKSASLKVVKTMTFKVKAKPNLETMVVNETKRELYFISKNDKLNQPKNVATVFALKEGKEVAPAIATLDFDKLNITVKEKDKVITAGDFDNDSQTLLLGTIDNAFEIKLSDLQSFKDKAKKIKMPKQEQSEAIAYYWDKGKLALVTTSEGKQQPLHLISCE